MTYNAASHQGANGMFWLHFSEHVQHTCLWCKTLLICLSFSMQCTLVTFKSADVVTTMFNITDVKLLCWQDLKYFYMINRTSYSSINRPETLSHCPNDSDVLYLWCLKFYFNIASCCNGDKSVIDGSMWSGLFHRAESRVYIIYLSMVPPQSFMHTCVWYVCVMNEQSADVNNLKWYFTLPTPCVFEVEWCHTFIWIMKWRAWQRTQVDWHTICCSTYVEMFLKQFNVHEERCVYTDQTWING